MKETNQEQGHREAIVGSGGQEGTFRELSFFLVRWGPETVFFFSGWDTHSFFGQSPY